MSAGGKVEKLQAAALHRLFSTLYWRGRRTARNQRPRTEVESAGRWAPLVMHAALGLTMLPFLQAKTPDLVLTTVPHVFTLMLTGMTMAVACGTLLFNDQESDILLHRPVGARLILLAKVRVLVMETFWLAFALNLTPLVTAALRGGGWWRYLPAHIATIGLASLFCASAVVLAFQLCLVWFGRERLNSLLTTSQVVITMALVLGSQFAPHLLLAGDPGSWASNPWLLALPPAWFGALDTLAVTGRPSAALLAGGALGVVITAGMAWLAFFRLAGTYGEALVALNEHEAGPPGKADRSGSRWAEKLTRLPGMRRWLRDPVERAGFLLTAAQLTRARDVKLRTYPQIAQFAVYPLIFAVKGRGTDSLMLAGMLGGFLGMIPLQAVSVLRYAEECRGADLFRFTPLTSPAPLFFGARKAALLLLVVPLFVVWSTVLWLISRDPAALFLLVPGIIVAHVMSLVPALSPPLVPFSEMPTDSRRSGLGCLFTALACIAALAMGFVSEWAWGGGWFLQWVAGLAVTAAVCDFWFRRVIRSAEMPPEA